MSHGWQFANLIVQAVLFVGVCIGAALAATHKYGRHCLFMRVVVGLQVVAIGVFMIVPLKRWVGDYRGWFRILLLVHHSLGVIVLLLFIYINLAIAGRVKAPKRMRNVMRSTLGLWLIVLALGGYIYYFIWR
jgi:uncharacterized membrane protein YozB (DUF420 family)